jgi:hypothetical protein
MNKERIQRRGSFIIYISDLTPQSVSSTSHRIADRDIDGETSASHSRMYLIETLVFLAVSQYARLCIAWAIPRITAFESVRGIALSRRHPKP